MGTVVVVGIVLGVITAWQFGNAWVGLITFALFLIVAAVAHAAMNHKD